MDPSDVCPIMVPLDSHQRSHIYQQRQAQQIRSVPSQQTICLSSFQTRRWILMIEEQIEYISNYMKSLLEVLVKLYKSSQQNERLALGPKGSQLPQCPYGSSLCEGSRRAAQSLASSQHLAILYRALSIPLISYLFSLAPLIQHYMAR